MTNPVSFFVAGEPQARQSVRFTRGGHAYQPRDKAAAWKGRVRIEAMKHRPRHPASGPVSIKFIFVLPRPKTCKRSAPAVKPDLDNLVKPVLDAIKDIFMRDDGQVVGLFAWKEYADPGSDPGVSIEVREI